MNNNAHIHGDSKERDKSRTRGRKKRNVMMVMALTNRRSMDAELVIIDKRRRSYRSREEADGGDVLMLKVVDSEGSSSSYRFNE